MSFFDRRGLRSGRGRVSGGHPSSGPAISSPTLVFLVGGSPASEGTNGSETAVVARVSGVNTLDTNDSTALSATVVTTGISLYKGGVLVGAFTDAGSGVWNRTIAGTGDALTLADAGSYTAKRTATVNGTPVARDSTAVSFGVIITLDIAPTTGTEGEDLELTIPGSPDLGSVLSLQVVTQLGNLGSPLVGPPAPDFEFTLSAVAPGSYDFQVRPDGGSLSTVKTVTVAAVGGTLVLPGTNQTVTEGDSVSITAIIAPSGDDAIDTRTSSIKFYSGDPGSGGTLIGTATYSAGTYSYTWNTTGASITTHTIWIRRTYTAYGGGTATKDSNTSRTVQVNSASVPMTLVMEMSLGSDTFTYVSGMVALDLTADSYYGESGGAGGGGVTNTGGGGGGAYAAGNVATGGKNVTRTVGTSTAGNAGGDSSHGTAVIAKGGSSGATGTGGKASACTGTITRDGGAGATGTGSLAGGGGAGSAAAGSGANGGNPQGGFSGTAGTAGARPFGAGGTCTAGAQNAGAQGWNRTSYFVAAAASTPRILGFSEGRTVGGAATSHAYTPPTGTGGKIVVFGALDGGANAVGVTGAVYGALTPRTEAGTSAVTIFELHRTSTGTDGTAITTASNTRIAWIAIRYDDADVPEWTTADGSSTNADPPNHTPLAPAGSAATIWLAGAGWDSGNSNAVGITAPPTGYRLISAICAHESSASGVAIALAYKISTASSENPGTFTSTNEQWCSFEASLRAP